MPVYKDNTRGTWYAKYTQKTADGKTKQVLKRGFRTKREAQDYEAQERNKVLSSSMVYEAVAYEYYKYRNTRDKTRDRQLSMLYKYAPFMRSEWRDIDKSVLMSWYLSLGENQNLKAGTKNLLLRVVKQIFKYGYDFYDLPNYAKGLKQFKADKKIINVWTVEEFNQFIKVVDLTEYRNIFYFLYYTGARKSEAINIRYDDIDGNKCHIRGTKTLNSDRTIILAPSLLRILSPVIDDSCAERPYIFGGEIPLPSTTLQWYFDKYIKLSGVKPIRIHDLRHSFASNMIAAGSNIVAVSRYLGHANINITLEVYAHLLKETEEDMVTRIEKLI